MRKKLAVNGIGEPDVPEKANTLLYRTIYNPLQKLYFCWMSLWAFILNHRPNFESLTCSMARLVLIPTSLKSRRRPPRSPSFTCWNPAEICRTAVKKNSSSQPIWVYSATKTFFSPRLRTPISLHYIQALKAMISGERPRDEHIMTNGTFCRKRAGCTFLPPSSNKLSLCGWGSGWFRLSLSIALRREKENRFHNVYHHGHNWTRAEKYKYH